ncbi:MAG: hypothetical protein AAF950_06950 [Pseudomonadota bacterium]
MVDIVNFPGTSVSAASPKKSALQQSQQASEDASYDPKRDQTLQPAIRSFTSANEATLDYLTDSSVSGGKVHNHRKCKLFFFKQKLDHINVNKLRSAMREFVEGLPSSSSREADFYIGPNYIRDPDWYLVKNRDPIDPFTFLRLHQIILAAEAVDYHRITNMTGLNAITQGGFDEAAFVSSIWAADPNLINDVLEKGGNGCAEEVIHGLQSNHGSRASNRLFKDFLLKAIDARTKRERVWYGLSETFAKALYSELEKIAKNSDGRIAPFKLMFPNSFEDSHEGGNRKVIALLKTDGNLL